MQCIAFFSEQLSKRNILMLALAAMLVGTMSVQALAQVSSSEQIGSSESYLFKQVQYQGNPILIHLRTDAPRALIMPEPVMLQGDQEQMPGTELAYEGDVVGFFATQTFNRRIVSFLGATSGTEYRFQIRASRSGFVEPLKIVR